MIDLHVHSYISDGTNSPQEIIKLAYDEKLRAVALTDHNSIEGLQEAELTAKTYGIEFINGIEISASYCNGRSLHILGLFIDPNNEYFSKAYIKMRLSREKAIGGILDILHKQGIHIDIEQLQDYSKENYIDRQAITKYMVGNGLCANSQEVWNKYLDPIPYGEGELFSIEEALKVIKAAGGLSFLAHFNKGIGLGGYSSTEIEEHVKALEALGLDGIERYYPTFNKEDLLFVDYLINKYNLIASGGTDFHGANRPEVTLGKGNNNFYIPDSVYDNIKQRLNK